jgi:hypothetical protein
MEDALTFGASAVTGQGTPRTASMNGEMLELARLHVIDGRRIVANQRQIIDRLKRDGRHPADAERTLELFEQS